MTGAPLPEGADCVLMQELTDSGEETVQLYSALKPQQNVVFRGGDIAAGAIIAAEGTPLTSAHLGVLAGQGYAEVPVYRTLTVGILSTGSELLEAGEAWAPGKIYDAAPGGRGAPVIMRAAHPAGRAAAGASPA